MIIRRKISGEDRSCNKMRFIESNSLDIYESPLSPDV